MISRLLGISRLKTQQGFRLNERAGATPVCEVCGAMVAFESQELHRQWHRRAAEEDDAPR